MKYYFCEMIRIVVGTLSTMLGICCPFIPGISLFVLMGPSTFWERLACIFLTVITFLPSCLAALACLGFGATCLSTRTPKPKTIKTTGIRRG